LGGKGNPRKRQARRKKGMRIVGSDLIVSRDKGRKGFYKKAQHKKKERVRKRKMTGDGSLSSGNPEGKGEIHS